MVALTDAFDKAAARVAAVHASHYLLSYCSPARGGVRELRIEVAKKNQNGGLLLTSSTLGFSAEGFVAGCSARDIPRFIVTLVSSESGSVPGIAPDSTPPPETHADNAPKPAAEGEEKAAENKGETASEPKAEEPEEKKEIEKPAAKPGKGPKKTAAKAPAKKPAAKAPAKPPAEKPAAKPAEKPAEKPPEKKPAEKKPPAGEEPDFRP
jgi:hypothetical protein